MEHLGFTGQWEPTIVYYAGDLSNVDLTQDWRFCEVKKRRKQAILLEVLEKEDFMLIKFNNNVEELDI